jgi:hypothetical protein
VGGELARTTGRLRPVVDPGSGRASQSSSQPRLSSVPATPPPSGLTTSGHDVPITADELELSAEERARYRIAGAGGSKLWIGVALLIVAAGTVVVWKLTRPMKEVAVLPPPIVASPAVAPQPVEKPTRRHPAPPKDSGREPKEPPVSAKEPDMAHLANDAIDNVHPFEGPPRPTARPEPAHADKDSAKDASPGGSSAPHSKTEAKQLLRAGARAVSDGDSVTARRMFERVVKGRYFVGDGYIGLARVAFEGKDFAKAVIMAHKAIDARGGTSAHLWLAHALFKDGQYKEAVKEYQVVLSKDPKNAQALSSIKLARQRAGVAP